MTIDSSSYELVARADGRRRVGALLRVTFEDGVRGYADVHPWPSLGDAALSVELERLARGCPERLGRRSLALARADGEARTAGRSLFEGLTVPPSHASLPFRFDASDLARVRRQGYERVKLKGWEFSSDDLALFRESGLLFRLDFNARPSFEEVRRSLDGWGDLGWIDWLEDPCPYNASAWEALRTRTRVAIDFEVGEEGFDVRVVKPARDGPVGSGEWRVASGMSTPHSSFQTPRSLAFTSYLDHPVGQVGAAWTAARAVAEGLLVETGGLATHEVYEPTEFSRLLGVREGRLVPPEGPGLGFGRKLETLEWRRLEA